MTLVPRLEFSTMTEEIRKMNSAGPRTKDTVHKIFKRAEKLINLETPDQAKLEALMDRLTRRGIEITRMDKKLRCHWRQNKKSKQTRNQPYRFRTEYHIGNSKSHTSSKANKIYRLANSNIVIQNKHQPQECM